ncbi:MAG: tRNA (guanosine(37)-N1)-methyltransferase TrmD [Spirochaetia bacterium]|nr:tRNA (guanosine(37)-N1)-methyltransferase TrmD [Spirochaetia bacterium]MCF7946528.1 tRNA (guanosine(37)-N1)-methyltransferase TrmD [Spirochaetia bacterium]
MNFTVLTLFPEIFNGFFENSIMAKSIQRGFVDYSCTDIRDFAFDRHKTCDDAPYGGGPGMVLKAEPLGRALESVEAGRKRVVYPTPSGKKLDQNYASDLAGEDELVFICGRYEGIDQRIIDLYVDDEISIGDYVISSGEVAAMVIIDAVYRLLDGVISTDSLTEESFSSGLLEYPHYTRPSDYCGKNVPDILLSGHHAEIEKWRLRKSVEKTLRNRPDLIERVKHNKEINSIIDELRNSSKGE